MLGDGRLIKRRLQDGKGAVCYLIKYCHKEITLLKSLQFSLPYSMRDSFNEHIYC